MRKVAAFLLFVLSGCAASIAPVRTAPPLPIEVQILAINDFHGNLEPPAPIELTRPDGSKAKVASGGAAHLAALLAQRRMGRPYSITVAAGDLIGASPLVSAQFLDEPTADVLGLMRLDLASVGNHEFDRGSDELRRIQNGGCMKFTLRLPCAIEQYRGARFHYLAANVRGPDGRTIFPATAIRQFGPIRVGFIGMTLKATATIVSPGGVRGLNFTDEASTANALVPQLKAEGADAIVLLIHQGGKTPDFGKPFGCEGLYGDILPIVDQLDPAITTVVSGHTHWGYVCNPAQTGGRLLTSAGKFGYFATDIRLEFDPASRRLIAQDAQNLITGNGDHGEDPAVKAVVDRYAAAAAPIAGRVVGTLATPAPHDPGNWESPAANLIADAYLAAAGRPPAGAQLAIVNASGVRTDFPAGPVTYGAAFAVMPFGNVLVTQSFTGAQIKAIFEQQYAAPPRFGQAPPPALAVSQGVTYEVDLARPAGQRVGNLQLGGRPIDPAATYRVVTNNYLASGGDGLSAFTAGTAAVESGVDLDALVAYLAPGRRAPATGRIAVVGRR